MTHHAKKLRKNEDFQDKMQLLKFMTTVHEESGLFLPNGFNQLSERTLALIQTKGVLEWEQ